MVKTIKTIIILSIFPNIVFAGNVNMNKKEDCALKKHFLADLSGIPKALCNQAIDRFKKGKQTRENLITICENTTNATWFMDRDNSMSDANDETANSMFIVSTKSGNIPAIQLCPGVVVTAAHGVLDSPSNGARRTKWCEENNRSNCEERGKVRGVEDQRVRIYPFPMTKRKYLNDKDLDFEYFSPILRNPSNWNDPAADYVLIKTNPKKAEVYAKSKGFNYKSQNYITLVSASVEDIKAASDSGQIDIHLYRGKTRFDWDSEAQTPVVNDQGEFDERTFNYDFSKIFNAPQRVNQRCEIGIERGNRTVSNSCPGENGVSGSIYATKVNGKHYVVGIHRSGYGTRVPSFEKNPIGTTFLSSAAFCQDYQKACGKPCPTLSRLLSI